jgi:hypothetical protein
MRTCPRAGRAPSAARRSLALEQVERRLQRGELLVLELELRQEVLLGAEGVELLARELVALRLEGHAEREQLRAVGIEPPRKCLVRHLRVALDVRLHVARRDRTPLRHQERDQRELADQLVRVVRHPVVTLHGRSCGSHRGKSCGN